MPPKITAREKISITPEIILKKDNRNVENFEDLKDTNEKDELLKKSRLNELEASQLKKSIILDFITGVQRGVRRHGIESVLAVIENLDTQAYFKSESVKIKSRNIGEIANYICEIVVSEFKDSNIKIEKEELFNKKSKRGELTVARKLAIILIKEFLEISDKQIARYFKRSRQVVFYLIKEYKKMDEKNRVDLKFLKRYDKLSKIISDKLTSANTNAHGTTN